MAATTGPARLWTAARQLPGRTPMRVKLPAVALALVTIALGIISITGVSVLRGYLIGQTDDQLQVMHDEAVNAGRHYGGSFNGLLFSPERFVVEAVTKTGQVYAALGSQPAGSTGPSVPSAASWLTANASRPVTVPARTGSGSWRVIEYPGYPFLDQDGDERTGTLIVGIDTSRIEDTISRLRSIDLIVGLIVLLGLAVVGIAVVRVSLRPLNEIEETAEGIAAGDLTRRVPNHDDRTEVGRLGRSLNTMLAQIEMAFQARAESESAARQSEVRMRQFVSDASHELRTPLTAIRGFAEYYRQRGGVQNGTPDSAGLPREDLDRIMQRVEQESARMGVLVEDLLLLARLDQQRPLENRPVDLLTLAADAVHDARVIAPGRTIQLTVEAGDAPPIVLGDDVRLRQVIGNLMSNALIHTPGGTPVEVRIRPGISGRGRAGPPGPAGPAGAYPAGMPGTASPGMPGTVVLEVADRGPGLTPEQAGRVFERFYRADQARTRQAGGAGLGLAIVAALVAAHGGSVRVGPTPGGGATFSITLPLAPEVLGPDEAGPAADEAEDGPDEVEAGPGGTEASPGEVGGGAVDGPGEVEAGPREVVDGPGEVVDGPGEVGAGSGEVTAGSGGVTAGTGAAGPAERDAAGPRQAVD